MRSDRLVVVAARSGSERAPKLVPDPREGRSPVRTVALGPDAGTFGLVRDPAALEDRSLDFPSAVTDLRAVERATSPSARQLESGSISLPASAEPAFTVILVDDLSRLSRDLVETLKLYRRLKRHGIELVAVTDGIQTSHQMAQLQITIKGLVNELYLDDLRDKTHWGLTGQALKGRSTGGRLFGYRTKQGPDGAEWIILEPEAEIVRRIFQEYAGGLSMKALTVRFPGKVTRHGPTRRGWAVSTIHTILSNEKYRGRWVWGTLPSTARRNHDPRAAPDRAGSADPAPS